MILNEPTSEQSKNANAEVSLELNLGKKKKEMTAGKSLILKLDLEIVKCNIFLGSLIIEDDKCT